MLKVVVVGAGRMGREHAHAISVAGDQVVAFLDPDIARAQRAAADLGGLGISVGDDIADALGRVAGRGASAVLVASPSALHLAHARAAISFGLPVLLEKPPWAPGQDPRPLLDAGHNGAVLAVGMTTRFNPGVQAVRRAVRSGALGSVLVASDLVAFTLAPGDLGDWYFDVERSGGGVLTTNGVHSLDRLAWILGQPLVLRSARLSSEMLRSCEDTALLELSAGDTRAHISELWGPGPVPPSELLVIGTRGSCWTDREGNWRLSSIDGSASEGRPPGYSELLEQWRSFRSLVLDGRRDDVLPEIDELVAPMDLLAEAVRWR